MLKILTCLVLSVFVMGCLPMPTLSPITNQSLTNENLENFNAYYDITITGSKISNQLIVNGSLKAQDNNFNKVTVNGYSNISNSVIEGEYSANGKTILNNVAVKNKFVLNGNLEANDCLIKKNIEAYTRDITLNNVKVNNIYIKSTDNSSVVKIYGGTQVKGDIYFHSGNGKVLIDINSRVHGSIYGAEPELDLLEIEVG